MWKHLSTRSGRTSVPNLTGWGKAKLDGSVYEWKPAIEDDVFLIRQHYKITDVDHKEWVIMRVAGRCIPLEIEEFEAWYEILY